MPEKSIAAIRKEVLLVSNLIIPASERQLRARPTPKETFTESAAMGWRALIKMRRNPEQFFDVIIQPFLFTAMFAYIFGGAISGSVQD